MMWVEGLEVRGTRDRAERAVVAESKKEKMRKIRMTSDKIALIIIVNTELLT